MSEQEQIAKLESLLDRIRRKAAEPRPAAATPASWAAPSPGAHAENLARLTPAAGTPAARISEPPPPPPEVEELDMMDAEIIEIDGAGAASPAPPEATELDLDEPVPESAPRAAQGHPDEADLEPPVKTPPPESGRQVMAPGPAIPPAPAAPAMLSFQEEPEEVDLSGAGDVDSLLEADHSGGPISKAPPGMPTMEQLGETVELEGADGPDADLELLIPAAEAAPVPDELELSLPKQEFAGGYDAALAPPSHAAADLERHRHEEQQEEALAAPPPSLSEPSSMAMSAMPPTEVAPREPLIVERPPSITLHAAEVIVVKPVAALPETFLALLDASLRL